MKKLFSIVIAMALLIGTTQTAFAVSTTSDPPINSSVMAYISSSEVKDLITEAIDFNELGTQTVYLENDIAFEYVSTEISHNSRAAYSIKSGTMSGRFYKTSNEQTVARYSLAVTFHYNGSDVYADDEDIQVTCSADTNWSIFGDYDTSEGSDWFSVDASYELYYDGNWNNDTFLDMSCDVDGNITKNYE